MSNRESAFRLIAHHYSVYLLLYAFGTQFLHELEKFFKLGLDSMRPEWHSTSCTRRYLSWIEGLTTNQDVRGSNPLRRTSEHEGPPTWEAFCFLG